MDNGAFSDLPNRHSIRLPNYDYASNGAYFVTINMGKGQLIHDIPERRIIILEAWHTLPHRFPGIGLDEIVVMPDHIHFIIWLDNTKSVAKQKRHTLSDVVGTFKSITAVAWIKYAKLTGIDYSTPLWHRNYYDHIIRNDQDLQRTRQYIIDNPGKLEERNSGTNR